ncbi:uncharacterized protein BCR38DRAFT_47732 [Pseudomassariella vexata]|uniref:Uncharacterized protein n=1 Tax=Pseudomassariella vexata TaxID=1141098 RepID=A0A1Y2DNL5_9PEZI|nr:uncharacterized protein BCR38DRAFT_47732 [Pseudomassariella vexata]ORY60840.1 hypothetical protein BCR38DRAFT_47732 [Pseudomassariella vexata]
MAEGMSAGAPTVSGTDEAFHHNNQPPPVIGLSTSGSASDANEGSNASSRTTHATGADEGDKCLAAPPSSTPRLDTTPPRLRAHFPDESHQLEHTFSTRPIPIQTRSSRYGENDRDPTRHRGAWQSFRDWWEEWRQDLGSPEKHQEITNLIGDTGIDVYAIRKMKSHGRIASLVRCPIL